MRYQFSAYSIYHDSKVYRIIEYHTLLNILFGLRMAIIL